MKATVHVMGCVFPFGIPQWNYLIQAANGLIDFEWSSEVYLQDGQEIETPDECWEV